MVIIPELLYDSESVQSICSAVYTKVNEQPKNTGNVELMQKNIFDIRIGI